MEQLEGSTDGDDRVYSLGRVEERGSLGIGCRRTSSCCWRSLRRVPRGRPAPESSLASDSASPAAPFKLRCGYPRTWRWDEFMAGMVDPVSGTEHARVGSCGDLGVPCSSH